MIFSLIRSFDFAKITSKLSVSIFLDINVLSILKLCVLILFDSKLFVSIFVDSIFCVFNLDILPDFDFMILL